jgi:predicted double-glycine peptidase
MRLRAFCLVAAAVLLPACAGTLEGPARFGSTAAGIGDFAVPVQSMEDRRFATVIRQRYDFSCGSAALATLLRYHYAGREDEAQVFRGMWAEGDRDQIRRLGFCSI